MSLSLVKADFVGGPFDGPNLVHDRPGNSYVLLAHRGEVTYYARTQGPRPHFVFVGRYPDERRALDAVERNAELQRTLEEK